ncbi:hypothetical protein LCGC14_0694220 [marine sediment metagenome]|uniref:Uncharacterized protein n=1 Tax=marine sediment metagenome TaxID=412755 RepID=A0A0F9QJR1_9ZZZZ
MAKKGKAEEKAEKKEKGPSKSKITCTKCEEVKAVRPEVFDKRVEKFGSEEKLRAGYLCQKCRPKKEKAKKEGKEE